jgi:hypothetical protein
MSNYPDTPGYRDAETFIVAANAVSPKPESRPRCFAKGLS